SPGLDAHDRARRPRITTTARSTDAEPALRASAFRAPAAGAGRAGPALRRRPAGLRVWSQAGRAASAATARSTAGAAAASQVPGGTTTTALNSENKPSPRGIPTAIPPTAGSSWAMQSAATTWPGVAPRARVTASARRACTAVLQLTKTVLSTDSASRAIVTPNMTWPVRALRMSSKAEVPRAISASSDTRKVRAAVTMTVVAAVPTALRAARPGRRATSRTPIRSGVGRWAVMAGSRERSAGRRAGSARLSMVLERPVRRTGPRVPVSATVTASRVAATTVRGGGVGRHGREPGTGRGQGGRVGQVGGGGGGAGGAGRGGGGGPWHRYGGEGGRHGGGGGRRADRVEQPGAGVGQFGRGQAS